MELNFFILFILFKKVSTNAAISTFDKCLHPSPTFYVNKLKVKSKSVEAGQERPTCVVDGVTYKDGESFTPKSDPEKTCYCMPGYEGKNIEPFCKAPNHDYCDPIMRYPDNIHNHCAPVYYANQSPQTDCSVSSRCQNRNDTVIHNHGELDHSHEAHATCLFGNLELHLGDELNQGTDYDSVCVKCICQVPPVPTCQRLPDSECDVTKHPQFN